jgi:hypothetical protein
LGELGLSALLFSNQAALSLLGLKFLPMDIADLFYRERPGFEKTFERAGISLHKRILMVLGMQEIIYQSHRSPIRRKQFGIQFVQKDD